MKLAVIGVVVVLVMLLPVSTALAQTQDDISSTLEGANHMKKMSTFIQSCTFKLQLGDMSVIQQCVGVFKDFNEHMTQLFADNREVIGEITFG